MTNTKIALTEGVNPGSYVGFTAIEQPVGIIPGSIEENLREIVTLYRLAAVEGVPMMPPEKLATAHGISVYDTQEAPTHDYQSLGNVLSPAEHAIRDPKRVAQIGLAEILTHLERFKQVGERLPEGREVIFQKALRPYGMDLDVEHIRQIADLGYGSPDVREGHPYSV